MRNERLIALARKTDDSAPYRHSVGPNRGGGNRDGRLSVVGLGPGNCNKIDPLRRKGNCSAHCR